MPRREAFDPARARKHPSQAPKPGGHGHLVEHEYHRPPPRHLAEPVPDSHPVHASWLNQAEIYFSIVQPKALQPNNFTDLETLEQHLLAFGLRYQQIAQSFEGKFTRHDLNRVLDKLDTANAPHQLAA